MSIENLAVNGKQIFIVDKHNEAIVPWARISSKQDNPPFLITLDHHTDTHEAFLGYAYKIDKDKSKWDDISAKLCKSIDKRVTLQPLVHL